MPGHLLYARLLVVLNGVAMISHTPFVAGLGLCRNTMCCRIWVLLRMSSVGADLLVHTERTHSHYVGWLAGAKSVTSQVHASAHA